MSSPQAAMRQIALLFPGQGAQAPGMGKGFYDRYRGARELYHRASQKLGFDVAALCFEGSQDELTRTETCQPALFVTSLAAFEAFKSVAPSVQPIGAAGLSLGEISALAAAGAIGFEDGVYLVQARGAAMADCAAHHRGAMLALMGMTGEALERLCKESGAWAANFNTPEQVVLSGSVEAIERAERLAKAQGITRAVRLEVAGAFHSPLMQAAAEEFRRVLGKITFRQPGFPVFGNVTAQPAARPEDIPGLLVKQLVSPVRWDASMRNLIGAGAGQFLEFPPARVLTGLLRRIDKSVKCLAIDAPDDFEQLPDLILAST